MSVATRRAAAASAEVNNLPVRLRALDRYIEREHPLYESGQVKALMQELCEVGLARPGVADSMTQTLWALDLLPEGEHALPSEWQQLLRERASAHLLEELYPDHALPVIPSTTNAAARAQAIAIRLLHEEMFGAIIECLHALGRDHIERIASEDERVRASLARLPEAPVFTLGEWESIFRDGGNRRFQNQTSQREGFRAALLTALGGRVAAFNALSRDLSAA
jgi:hypothetical protein